jgi:hypothetical protein
MAQKRMFDKAIIDTDRFMDLSMSSKALYFLLGMEADDEGFVSYKKVMRIHGGNEDDVKILVAKKFLIAFESGVVVITDWNDNNYLDKNRIKTTQYKKERSMLMLTSDRKYVLNNGLTSIEESSIEEDRGEESSTSKATALRDNSLSEKKTKELMETKNIVKILDAFSVINPSIKEKYNNKTERKACVDLINVYGKEKVLHVITEVIPKVKGVEFIIYTDTPKKLFDNWSRLESDIAKKFGNQNQKGKVFTV